MKYQEVGDCKFVYDSKMARSFIRKSKDVFVTLIGSDDPVLMEATKAQAIRLTESPNWTQLMLVVWQDGEVKIDSKI